MKLTTRALIKRSKAVLKKLGDNSHSRKHLATGLKLRRSRSRNEAKSAFLGMNLHKKYPNLNNRDYGGK